MDGGEGCAIFFCGREQIPPVAVFALNRGINPPKNVLRINRGAWKVGLVWGEESG